MDRVTSYPGPLSRIVDLLADLTLPQLHAVKVEAVAAEARLRARLDTCADRDRERRRGLLLRHYAKGGEPLKVVPGDGPTDRAAPHEEEAVLQGQDGPDPVYRVAPRVRVIRCDGAREGSAAWAVTDGLFWHEYPTEAEARAAAAPELAPRFGGVECRSVPADRPEGLPDMAPEAWDALAPVYGLQRHTAALTEADRCPLTGDAPADPDADDDADDTPLVVPPFTDEQEGE